MYKFLINIMFDVYVLATKVCLYRNYIKLYIDLCLIFLDFYTKGRSSRPEVFLKKCVLRNLAKFVGKYLCQISFSIKLQARPATLLKIRLWHRCFPVNFAKFLRTHFLQNTSGGCFCKVGSNYQAAFPCCF